MTKERIEKDQQVAKNLGLIEVKVERGIYVMEDYNHYDGYAQLGGSSFELAERSLKGKSISHGTM